MENNVREASQFLYRYYDVKEIPQWSWLFLETAAREGYLLSYEDQTIRPTQAITRAETVYALEQIIGPAYVEDQRYGPESGLELVEGNAVISTDGVVLRNTEIQGDLYITEGVGDGNVRLENVIVHGTTRIKGGGPESITLQDTTLADTVILKKDGNVNLELRGSSSVESMVLHSGVTIDATRVSRKIIDVLKVFFGDPDHEVHLTGDFKNVEVYSGDMYLKLDEGEMNDLIIDDDVKNADIKIQSFVVDDITCSDSKSSKIRLYDSQVDQLVLNHDQDIDIKDSTVKTLTFNENVDSPDVTLENASITTFNIYSGLEFKTYDTDVTHLKLMDESGELDLEFIGGNIDKLLITERPI